MEEPSVLDYVKSKIFFWRREVIRISSDDRESIPGESVEKSVFPTGTDPGKSALARGEIAPQPDKAFSAPGPLWIIIRVLGALFVGSLAQRALEPPSRSGTIGIVFYFIAIGLLLWSNLRGEWLLAGQPAAKQKQDPLTLRLTGVWMFIILSALAFLMFGNNRFTAANLLVWILALTAFIYAFWIIDSSSSSLWERWQIKWIHFKTHGISLSPWTLLVLVVIGISAFYRFYLLNQVPAEMFSDHAEKLLDVRDVLNGQTSIFFPRNTGREAFQMYLTAAMALIFKTGESYLSLKLGTALCGFLTLPFIYLLGVEIANRRAGLLAMFLAGIAYWPNVISRVALRFTLYPTFAGPVLLFLIRGLRRRNRNDFIISGIFLGLGLHGYSPFRFVPIVVVVGVGLYLIHRQAVRGRMAALWGLILLAFSALIVFLPLLRYVISDPTAFSYRMMTRMGELEQPFPEPPLKIFFENLWKAVIMPMWNNGQIWVHSIPDRPALGIVSAVLFVFGVVLLFVRYLKEKNWLDIFLLISIPLLMMPSILSLAFPDENPSLNRTGGSLIVIFLIAGMAFDSLLSALKTGSISRSRNWLVLGVSVILLIWSSTQDYDLVFNQYAQMFRTNAWNTSELGAIIRQFADSAGAEDSAWVIPYPHWVDTRLVGIRAGVPDRDYALWPEQIIDTVDDPRAKLYLVKPEDTETLSLLMRLYPTGILRLYESQVRGRDFYMYSVLPAK